MNSIRGYMLLVDAFAAAGALAAWIWARPRRHPAPPDTDAQIAYDLGFSAGYCGTSLAFNPYRRGWLRLGIDLGDQTSLLANQWDAGNVAGHRLARADLRDKRLIDAREDDRE